MKTIFAILSLTFASTTFAATYEMVPNAKTESLCRDLGFIGEFRLLSRGSRSFEIVFASGTSRVVKRKANGVYRSIVSCSMGCMGYAEVKLNLNTGDFHYWNSIDRAPQECTGKVRRAS